MDIESLKIKTRTNYNWDDIVYINDFDSNLLEVIKRESRIGADIYYIGYVLNPNYDYNTINSLYFIINRLIGYIEEIEGSDDKYLVLTKSMRNRKKIHSFDNGWSHIEHKINPDSFNNNNNNNNNNNSNNNNNIKDYDKLRFKSDIDLPTDTLTEFRSLVINVSCVVEKDGKYYPEICLDECLYVRDNV